MVGSVRKLHIQIGTTTLSLRERHNGETTMRFENVLNFLRNGSKARRSSWVSDVKAPDFIRLEEGVIRAKIADKAAAWVPKASELRADDWEWI